MPPYRSGEKVVWLSVEDEGIRVRSTTVLEVKAEAPDRWLVRTRHGTEIVDGKGIGNVVLPVEREIAGELYANAEGFVVQRRQRELPWEQERDRHDRDRGGWGW